MAYEFYSPLQFQGGFISGSLAGQLLSCLVSALPGSMPPAGVYQIQPPVEDLVFGQVAVMTMVGRSDGGGATSAEVMRRLPGGASASYEFNPQGGVSASLFDKFVPQGGVSASIFEKMVPQGSGGSAFVLSSRPIPGRNCLVIQSNFADLMDTLQKAGGATVRFA